VPPPDPHCAGFAAHRLGPWTLAGRADPDFCDSDRQTHHRFPERGELDYDDIVRCLDYVWDCPHDASANVTGYCCAVCGRTRAAALSQAPVSEAAASPRA